MITDKAGNIILGIGAMLIAASLPQTSLAQDTFPTNRREDSGGVMSEAYWNLWNDRVNVKIDAELHSDLERLLLEAGSAQESLWGFNIYPEQEGEDFIEFDSLINIRPRQKNMSRDVENPDIRKKIIDIVNEHIR